MSLKGLGELLEKELGIASDESAEPKNWLDTGIPYLNERLSGNPDGGLPTGRIIEVFGESSSGKTMLATKLMISAQRQGGFAGFYDHERSYDKRLSIKQGMSDDKDKFLYREGKTFEGSCVEAINIARYIRDKKLIDPSAPIAFVFDSFAAMVPASKLTKEVDAYTMADTTALARAASAVLPAFNQQVADYNVCAIFLNQMAETMDMYGPKTKTKGGKSLPFYASVRLQMAGKEVKDKGKLIKKEMTILSKKNKVFMPHQSIDIDFNFNSDGSGDFDVIAGYAQYLKNIGAIESAGPRVVWGEGKPYLSQVIEELRKNDKAIDLLKKLHNDWKAAQL